MYTSRLQEAKKVKTNVKNKEPKEKEYKSGITSTQNMDSYAFENCYNGGLQECADILDLWGSIRLSDSELKYSKKIYNQCLEYIKNYKEEFM